MKLTSVLGSAPSPFYFSPYPQPRRWNAPVFKKLLSDLPVELHAKQQQQQQEQQFCRKLGGSNLKKIKKQFKKSKSVF
jgi:hypothetical protein